MSAAAGAVGSEAGWEWTRKCSVSEAFHSKASRRTWFWPKFWENAGGGARSAAAASPNAQPLRRGSYSPSGFSSWPSVSGGAPRMYLATCLRSWMAS